jgi:hypothetical protein
MPTQAPVTTPVITPTTNPDASPLWETYTSPDRICPQQVREGASPDVEP